MSRLMLRASCAFLLIAAVCCQSRFSIAKQADNDWYKRVAPEKCLSYVAWNSDAEETIEGNATQALMTEPEVRDFIDDLKRCTGLIAPAVMTEQGMPKEKIELAHILSPKLAASIFERSGCMYIEEVVVARNAEAPPAVKVAMMIDLGDEADKFVTQMAEIVGSKDQVLPQVDLAGTKAYRVELAEQAGTLYFGNTGQILVVAIGEQTYSGAIERMKGTQTPDWLSELDQRSQTLKHVHSLAFLDVKEVMRSIRKVFGPNANVVGELLGVSSVKKIQVVAGLDAEGSSTHVLLDASELEGLLGLFAKNPVNDSFFENVPADSLGAMAMTLDVDGLLDLLKTLGAMMGPGSDLDEFKQEFRDNTGVDLEVDLLQNLGNSWVLFNGASDGWLTGLTMVGEIKNAKELTASVEKCFKALAQRVKEMPQRFRPGFFKRPYAEETIYSMTFPDVFVEFSFCIKQDRIYIGMYPQAVMTAIKGLPTDEVLLNDMQVKKLNDSSFLKGSTKLSGMVYADTKLQGQLTYPYMHLLKTGVSTIFRRQVNPEMIALLEGMELPPARTVIRKIKPTMVLVRTSEHGIEIEARQTVPTNTVAIGIPVAVGMLLPAVGQVRTAARQTQSSNNLRQLALASLNYESVHQRLPKDDSNFSWRVQILPFIEQSNLYDRIKFDEPWDSEHNKTVLAKTPDVYKAPGSNLPEGMTVYRGFKEGGILGGLNDKGVSFGQITDGSSNTILVAQVPDEMATHWAKPDCLEVNDEVIKKLLSGKKKILTAFCDGSVNQIPTTIGAKDWKNLLNPNDGNIVNWGAISPRNQQWQDSQREADPRFILPTRKKSF